MAGLTLAMFGDVLLAGDPPMLTADTTDVALQFAPFRHFGFGQLRRGELPLWNPHVFSGMPCLGNLQSALLYPPNWLHLVLPLKQAVNWGIALHVFLAGWFTALWCLGNGVRFVGAILAGTMFMFGTPYFLHVYAGHLPFLSVTAWAPALLFTLDRMRVGDRILRWTLVGGAIVAVQTLGGYPQAAYYAALVAAPYHAWLARRSRRRSAVLAGFVGMYAIGVAVAAVQVLPSLALYSESVRGGGLGYDFAASFSMPPENFLTLLSPHVLGDMSPEAPYFGRWFAWEVSMFVGVVGLTLAAIGAASARGPLAAIARAMVVVVVVLSLGNHTPVFAVLYEYFPGFRTFRAPARWLHLAALFLALLAGLGWSRLAAGGGVRRARWAATCGVAASLVGGVALLVWISRSDPTTVLARAIDGLRQRPDIAFTAAQRTDPAWVEASVTQIASQLVIPTALLLLVATVLAASTRWRRCLFALPVVGGLELFLFAYSYRATADALPPVPAAWSAELSERGDDRFWFPEPTFFNVGMLVNADSIWGYDPIILRRYAEFMAWTQGIDPDTVVDAYHLPFRRTPRILSVLRTRAVLTSEPPHVVRLPDPMSRLALVHEWVQHTSRDEILRALTADDFDPRRTVVLESAPDPLPAPASGPERARVVRSTTDELEIAAELAAPAILLVTDSYSAGWRALPLGESAQEEYRVLPADYVLRGIPLAAGRHHFLLQYAPPAFRVGRWVSLIAVLGWAVLAASELRRRS
jgi:hypothetical protein